MPERCVWCNRSTGSIAEHRIDTARGSFLLPVHDHHLPAVRRFCAGAARFERKLLPILLIALLFSSVVVAVVGSVSAQAQALLIGLLLLALAAILWIYPYATPFTVGWIGMRRSVVLVRVLALVVVALGLMEILPPV